ncbi:MAG TPA: hypothetical protein VGA01_02275 [Candidatus Binatia bacterium]
MSKVLRALLLTLSCVVAKDAQALDAVRDLREGIAKEFEGTYRFNYLFAENGVLYLDESSHFQLLDFDHTESESAPRITFFNQTSKGEKRAHYSYVFYQEGNKLTLCEFDGGGNFRFACVGTYQPEKRLLECVASRAPKPARDTDSPATRKSGLFKRPISWPVYESLMRHNIFRFYEWGFVNLQENLKLDANGKTVARESGVITAVKLKSRGSPPAAGN